MVFVQRLFGMVAIGFCVACGGGGSSCPDDAPLECGGGTCCPRGFPYSCGNGLCYEYGCPPGSPEVGICEFKLAPNTSSKTEEVVPILPEEDAGESVLQSELQ
jgi:hypothetical protein